VPVATVYLVAIWVVSIYKVVIDFPIAHWSDNPFLWQIIHTLYTK